MRARAVSIWFLLCMKLLYFVGSHMHLYSFAWNGMRSEETHICAFKCPGSDCLSFSSFILITIFLICQLHAMLAFERVYYGIFTRMRKGECLDLKLHVLTIWTRVLLADLGKAAYRKEWAGWSSEAFFINFDILCENCKWAAFIQQVSSVMNSSQLIPSMHLSFITDYQ